jgi:pimeloyl-ACP methyl ester carboxylesterase
MAGQTSLIRDALDTKKIHWVDVDGVRTRYYEDGSGEPLVLVHGGGFAFVDSLDCWSLNFDGLAESFHVYALDKLGQGHTDNPKSDREYTYDALVQHTLRWLQALGITRAHLVGHSRGGLLVTTLALEHPGLAKTLVIVDSGTLAPDDPRYITENFYKDVARRIPPGAPSLEAMRAEPVANSYSPDHVTGDYLHRNLEIARLAKTKDAQQRVGALGMDDTELGRTLWMPSLQRGKKATLEKVEQGIPVPTLVVWGMNDPSAPLPLGLALFDRIAGRTAKAEFHVLNRAGHYCFREQVHEFNRLIKVFCVDAEFIGEGRTGATVAAAKTRIKQLRSKHTR